MAERSARLGRRKPNLSDVIYGDKAIEQIFGEQDESTEEEEDEDGVEDEDDDENEEDDDEEEDIPASKKGKGKKSSSKKSTDDGELFTVSKGPKAREIDQLDTYKMPTKDSEIQDWSDDEVLQTIRSRFITGENEASEGPLNTSFSFPFLSFYCFFFFFSLFTHA